MENEGQGPATPGTAALIREYEMWQLLRLLEWSELSEATGSWEQFCPICHGGYGNHREDCRLARMLYAAQPPPEAVPEIERLKAENASLLESLRAAEKKMAGWGCEMCDARIVLLADTESALAAAEQRAEAAEKGNTELQGALRAARQAMEWATEDDADEPLRSSTIGKLYQAIHAVDEALKGPAAQPPTESVSSARAALHDEERSAPPQEGEDGK